MNPKERACSRRSGPDCRYLTFALSYWCTNKACCRWRGGWVNCPYYRPVEEPSPWWENLLLAGLLLFYVTLTIILVWSLL